uniref:B box-type domain-containing protein n=1 Tax=Leptobrachium leishanense TaxID=445787 RepID=A0A8C5MN59_9ANUR
MALAAEDASQLPFDGTCDACEPDEAKEAVEICDDCGFAYCEFHSNEHGERFGDHRVRHPSQPPPEEQASSSEEPAGDDKKKCPTHNQELTLYCKDDEKIICVLCAVTGAHRQHELITLNEAYQEIKNRKPVDLKLAMGEMVEKLKGKVADPHDIEDPALRGIASRTRFVFIISHAIQEPLSICSHSVGVVFSVINEFSGAYLMLSLRNRRCPLSVPPMAYNAESTMTSTTLAHTQRCLSPKRPD